MNYSLCEVNWELVIASTAIIVTLYTLYNQRRHNKLSFKPIPVIVTYNYLNVIRVKIWNKGTGPLIIKSFKVKGKNNLIELMTPQIMRLTFVEFIKDLKGRAISPNDSLNIFEFKVRADKKNIPIPKYVKNIQDIRVLINGLEIHIEYEDIYGTKMSYKSEPLDFGLTDDEEFNSYYKLSKH